MTTWTRSRVADAVACLLIAVFGVAVSVVQHPLLSKPFWIDETWRPYRLSQPFSVLVRDRSLGMAPMPFGWAVLERLVGLPANVEWTWRFPELVSLTALVLLSYALCRRYLPVVPSAATAAVIGLHPSMLGYSVSMKQYCLDAAVAVGVVLAWQLGETASRAWARTVAAGPVCLGVLLSIPAVLLLPSLYLITTVRTVADVRGRRWRRSADAGVAVSLVAAVALVHYEWWLKPQSSVAGEWAESFPPHALRGALSFFYHRTVGWLHLFVADPDVVPKGSHLPTLLAALVLLVVGFVAALLRSQWREVAVLLAGTWLVMAAVSWMQRWPFGYLRTSLFALPLVYLVVALGATAVARAVMTGAYALRGRPRSRYAAPVAAAAAVVLAVLAVAPTVRAGARSLASVQARLAHPEFAFQIRQLVADTRPRVTPDSVAIVLHPRSIEAWLYYMNAYRGYDARVAHAPRLPGSRTLYPPIESRRLLEALPAQQLTAFLAAHRADRVFVYAMFLMPQHAINTVLGEVERDGYRVTGDWYATVSGRVYQLDRG